MLFKKIAIVASAISLALSPISAGVTFAKDSGSSRSSSSSKSSGGGSSFSKPSSSPAPASKPSAAPPASVSKPAAPPAKTEAPKTEAVQPVPKPETPTPAATPPSQNGFSKPGAVATGAAGGAPIGAGAATAAQHEPAKTESKPSPKDALSSANQKAVSADNLKALQAERAQAQKPPQKIAPAAVKTDPTFNNASKEYAGDPNRYVQQRNVTYNIYRNQHPEMFSYNRGMSPNYGIFDSNFLTGMFVGAIGNSMMHNAMWLSAQQHQPWYPAYRADLDRQAQDNAELRAKLAAMDLEIAKVKAGQIPASAQQQAVSPTELPPGIDASVAISPEAVMEAADTSKDSSGHGLLIFLGLVSLALVGGVMFFAMRK